MDSGEDEARQGLGDDNVDNPPAPQGVDASLQELGDALPKAPVAPQASTIDTSAAAIRARMNQFIAAEARKQPAKRSLEAGSDSTANKAARTGTATVAQQTAKQSSRPAGPSYAHPPPSSSSAMETDRQRPPQPTTVAPVDVPSAAPSTEPVVELPRHSRHPETPCQELMRATAFKIRAAVSISNEAGEVGHIVGNPFGPMKGMAIILHPDGGRYGDPSISLRVKINKENKTDDMSDEEFNVANIVWYPGAKLGELRSMEDFYIMAALDNPNLEMVRPPALMARHPKDGRDMRDMVVCITFQSGSHVQNGRYNPSWTAGLPKETEQGLNDLFRKKGKRTITIWFVNPLGGFDVPKLAKTCLGPIQWAVKTCRKSLAQYSTDDLTLSLELDDYPTIQEIGNGMYKRARKLKGQESQNFEVLPEQIHWKTHQEFEISAVMPSVRDRQYVKGQYATLALATHSAYLHKFTNIEVDPNFLPDLTSKERQINHNGSLELQYAAEEILLSRSSRVRGEI